MFGAIHRFGYNPQITAVVVPWIPILVVDVLAIAFADPSFSDKQAAIFVAGGPVLFVLISTVVLLVLRFVIAFRHHLPFLIFILL